MTYQKYRNTITSIYDNVEIECLDESNYKYVFITSNFDEEDDDEEEKEKDEESKENEEKKDNEIDINEPIDYHIVQLRDVSNNVYIFYIPSNEIEKWLNQLIHLIPSEAIDVDTCNEFVYIYIFIFFN